MEYFNFCLWQGEIFCWNLFVINLRIFGEPYVCIYIDTNSNIILFFRKKKNLS